MSRGSASRAPSGSVASSWLPARRPSAPTARRSPRATRPGRRGAAWRSCGALEKLGAGLSDVVRTRILLTRIEDWEAVGRVHGEVFADIRPVNTVMQVTRFIDPEWLVEIEADAVRENER